MKFLGSYLSRFAELFQGSEKDISKNRKGGISTPGLRTHVGPSLRAEHLVRAFGTGESRAVAVKGVSLDLYPGEVNLMMGPSGSGKSTLLAIMSALLKPCSGRVEALGHDLWEMTPQQLEQFRLEHCSYIFQGYNLFPALTARQQLEVVLRWGEGATSREARKRSDYVLGQLGMSDKAHLRPKEMSGGEKQRVAIARALVKNPSFLFADEPTSALDWENGQQVIDLLTDVAKERGATVLVVTHDHRLLPFADRVFELTDGLLERQSHLEHQLPAAVDNHKSKDAFNKHPKPEPRLTLRDPMFMNH